MKTLTERLAVCRHDCPHCDKEGPTRFVCALNGKAIQRNVRDGTCEAKRFSGPTSNAPPPLKAEPPNAWPLWARTIGKLRADGDTGVGDTVHRQLGTVGEAFKKTMSLMGAPCGCDARRAEWNTRYPY